MNHLVDFLAKVDAKRVLVVALVVMVLGVLGSLTTEVSGAPQQAVQWIQICFWTIWPYCTARLVLFLMIEARKTGNDGLEAQSKAKTDSKGGNP